MGRIFEHESGVLGEPFDDAFVSGVNEDRRLFGGAAPESFIDQVSLLEFLVAIGGVGEVV